MKNRKTPGQIAVIITLFIAVIILLSVVVINIGKVSDAKVTSSQISDRGALSLCSQLGTYVGMLNKKVSDRSFLVQNCAPNWGLILIALSVVVGLITAPGLVGAALMAGFLTSGVAVQMADMNAIQARAFSDAAYSMSSYTAFRESAIETMLRSAQTDTGTVKKTGTYTLTDEDPSIGTNYVFDKNNPGWWAISQALKENKRISRFNAWYWSKRFPEVAESGKLTPLIENFIKVITDNTKIEEWNKDKWEIVKLSLKSDASVTTAGKKWVIDGSTVRLTGPVKLNDWATKNMPDWLKDFFYLDEGGFLIADTGFKGLTQRLLDTVCFDETCDPSKPAITYATKIPGGKWFGLVTDYKYEQLYQVNDDLYGFLTRSMELLNLPVSYRLIAINNWLPAFYNENGTSDPKDLFTRLKRDQKLVNEWVKQLKAVHLQIMPIIPLPNGDCVNGTGNVAGDCSNATCCRWNDSGACECECRCCGSHDCTWYGNYCSCSRELHSEWGLCGHGDLYGDESACAELPSRFITCPCGDCPGPHEASSQAVRSCRFQGAMNWKDHGPTEILQAIEILDNLNDTLKRINRAIESLGIEAEKVLKSTAAKEEAVYGWSDKDKNHHVVRVKVEGYPEYEKFPTIVESDKELYGLLKCWSVEGATTGKVKTRVSNYMSDVPTGWWDLKVRKNPGTDQFKKESLENIIKKIHQTGTLTSKDDGDLAALLDNYAITSATQGNYGSKKTEIYITRDK